MCVVVFGWYFERSWIGCGLFEVVVGVLVLL